MVWLGLEQWEQISLQIIQSGGLALILGTKSVLIPSWAGIWSDTLLLGPAGACQELPGTACCGLAWPGIVGAIFLFKSYKMQD